jgi:AmmeMemoRadiSam system protein B
VPIVCSTQSYEKLIKFSKSLAKTIKKQEKENPNLKFVIIASSDLTHYGPEYGFSPFPLDSHTKKNLYSLDNSIIQEILKLDPKGFYNQTSKSTVCGKSPIVIAIETSKLLGAKSGQLLKYYVSGDIVQEYENSVGYASLVIR